MTWRHTVDQVGIILSGVQRVLRITHGSCQAELHSDFFNA
jgi:hypothetical protein